VVELPSGGAMMIAGLLESVNKQTISSLPGLTQLPVLGALFRSRDYQQGETELVVIVTPYLVKPTRPDQIQTPADGMQFADDASTYLLGQLNKTYGGPTAAPPPGKTYQGPFGYVVQ
jgi:pilus assembly protein CpaC